MRPLDLIAARQPQQPFAGAVVGDLLGDDLGPVDGEMFGELRARMSFETLVISSKLLAPRK